MNARELIGPPYIGSALLLCSLLFGCAGRAYPALTDMQKAEIETRMRDVPTQLLAHLESWPDRFVKEYGPEAVPVLLELLRTERSPRFKGWIAYHLGYFRDKRAVQPIIDLFRTPLPKGMTVDELGSLTLAMSGLGFSRADAALEYLAKLATDEYWQARPVHPRVPGKGYNEVQARLELRKWAIRGLGNAGNRKAIAILKRIKGGVAKDLAREVDWAIEAANRRIEYGPPWEWIYYDKNGKPYRIMP